MAITSTIIMTLLSVVGQSTETYTRTQRALNTLSQARAFMQFFEREISTRLPETPILHEIENAPSISDKFAFVRTISLDEQTTTTPGDLGTSFYYVAFTPTIGSDLAPRLFRKVLNPEQTQALLEAPASPVLPTADISSDEAIIDNILSFQARPKFADTTSGELTDWDENSTQPPSAIELTIRFIDESSARRFTSESDWNRLASSPTESEKSLIQSFSRTIAIAK